MSRRLQHLKESHVFRLRCGAKAPPNTEHLMLKLVDEHVRIFQKHLNKGHTKQNDIKLIEPCVRSLKPHPNGLLVTLDVHVAHYTKLYFAVAEYAAELNAQLMLMPGSVTHITTDAEAVVDSTHTAKPSFILQ